MRLPPIDAARAADLISRFTDLPVLVVGDVMLDRFIVGRVTRISPEAPVPVVHFQSEHYRLGGAANVAHNIVALGGRPSLVGLVGGDAAAETLREQVKAAGIRVNGLVEDRTRPTTEKVRVVTERNQQVARIDRETDSDARGDVRETLLGRVKSLARGTKAVLVSDYLKGTVSGTLMKALVAISRGPGAAADDARPKIPLIVDPKVPHLDCYAGATLVTPNHHEAEAATHRLIRSDEEVRAAARDLRQRLRCDAALITRGEHGMWLVSQDVEGSIPALAREVADVTGAGDTVVATLALALAAGATLAEAAILANHAAGIVVGKFGPATLTQDELRASVHAGLPAIL
jgi:D-beta-D-heptose 7-phosphate kinase/D-beta-D-heptose 1-phosphate adenosyltransferase